MEQILYSVIGGYFLLLIVIFCVKSVFDPSVD